DDGACHDVKLANGEQIRANIVIVGIGIAPNVDLAIGADLLVDGGIIVDDHARTTDPNIYACGDCSMLPFNGEKTRLESVQNANDQGAAVAANILGEEKTYLPEPWFWSDQFDMKLQIAGLNRGYDQVITRPGKREGSRSHFYFAQEKFIAVDCMNDAAVYAMSRRILASGAKLTPDQAADQDFNLKSLMAS
ncbi:MAG: oxidoreductase C-terminal domain-containing protein, partial [Pseudomonadota bacterium]